MTIDSIIDLDSLDNSQAYKMYVAGVITVNDYQTVWAINKGYVDYNDYYNKYRYTHGGQPMSENKNCSCFLGVHVAERVLSKIFENVHRMPYGNSGYDFLCKNEFKIEVKSSCLLENRRWAFNIKKNKIADYFLLLAFDNRAALNPLYIWLIKSDEITTNRSGGVPLNEKGGITIHNTLYSLSHYIKYEQTDKLEKLINYCDTLR